jgi:hypothetical protein
MKMTAAISVVVASGFLAGCDVAGTQGTGQALAWDEVTADVARASEESLRELPFTRGVIAVVATEDGELSSWQLFSCQNGTGVCAGSPQGQAAQVQRTDRHFIVQGLYGRTFFLRPGGGGTLRNGNVDTPLAWNAYANGVPLYPQPMWPYTPWITQTEPGPNP